MSPAPSSHTPPTPKGKKWWIAGASLLAILIIAWRLHSASHNGAHRHGDTPPAVAVAAAHRANMPIVLQLLGTVVPVANVTITPRVSGHILAVYYQEGQHVHRGDVLELIDPRPYEATLHQYQGTLAADRAQLAKARVDSGRYQRLIKQNSTSAMLARDQEFTVEQLEGQVAFDEANVRNAELNLMYCHITAPVDGRVGIRALDIGNYVTVGQSGGLTTLTQMQPISVIFTLPQNNLPEVQEQLNSHPSLTVEAWSSDNTHKLATGTVNALDSQIDTSTGTVRLRGIFPNEDERLFPNEFVNAHLLVQTIQNALLVPSNAVQTGPDGQFVYVIEKDMTAAVHPVKLGQSDDNNSVILSGVAEGDRIVTDGINHLRPGSKVTIAAGPADATTTHP
ncbi:MULTISPECIES: efflux RND transporter periplasmic adaptor subunit [Bombella]|uniref:Efflux RND transporter periplasmic adaptor subunit n=1 Tax=Bombella pollinis TaxID=2967337 RepID=A0ABT3WMJ5_9PROT|nr:MULTISPECIES: efflux RND transporter periplasmic adaptor subunit [Bombella]MCX5620206.1 efflux RND transporter periplasmic adaptor subunit [Bombella pollinis]MUG05030.1 efflux RND transporter periplasmic adaptor subunit [Bombella sp. ESL0378]MUG90577.1 efflux RND transporter periplasmic adaptor subunit [Bombella sp. ESL0385]